MLDGADRDRTAVTLAQLPPPLRVLYHHLEAPLRQGPRAGNRCGARALRA